MRFRILSLIVLIGFSIAGHTQLSKYARFTNLETNLFGHAEITSQVWMNDGSFWAATESGVVHHNGNFGEDFDADQHGSGTVVSKDIIRLNKLSENEIWISYRDTCVLTLLNPQTNEFKHYCVEELMSEGLLEGLVVRVFKDKNEQLWLCTWGMGLVRWSPSGQNNKVFIFNNGHEEKKSAGRFVKDVWQNDDSTFIVTFFNEYVGHLSYPGIFDPKDESFQRIDIDALVKANSDNESHSDFLKTCFKIVHFIHQDDNGKFWIGSYSGLLFVDFENNVVERVYDQEEDKNYQNQVNVLQCVESNGQLWIATVNMGVMAVDTDTKDVVFHLSDAINTSSIYSNRIKGISKDPQGNIWIANGTGVLSVYTPFIHKFKILYWKDLPLDYSNRSAQNIPVNQLYVKDSRNIYVSTRPGLLVLNLKDIFDYKNYQIASVEESPRLKSGLVHFKTIGDKIYVQHDYHYGMLDLETGRVEDLMKNHNPGMIPFRHDTLVQTPMIFRNVKKHFRIKQYDNELGDFKIVSEDSVQFDVSETFSFVTHQGKWIISESKGRFVLTDPIDFSHELFSPSQKSSYFPDSTVNCVLIQNSDEILIGTAKGLYKFNEVTYAYEDLSSEIGLRKGEGVYSMVKDHHGKVWMALNNELLCWSEKDHSAIRYGKTRGVDVSDFLPAIAQKDELGNLYFVGMYGILVFHPDEVALPEQKFELNISKISVNEQSLNQKEISEIMEGQTQFHWSDNYIEFYFHTNQVFQISPHKFMYKLEGLNERWISCGGANHVRFDNLQHGEYNLLFKGINSFGVESEVISIPFSIKKPFWLAWWFFCIMAMFLALVVYLAVKGRMAALRKRSELLEKTVEERTAEVVEQKQEAERQKAEAEHQKEIVEEKQKEITDSITYAKRIQEAIMPSEEVIKQYMPKAFVMYRPKDIVAGDFYWMEPLSNDEVIFAVADCTGHGVPGAMVSVVCNNALNRTVREFKVTNPGNLLDNTRDLVVEQFDRSVDSSGAGDDQTIKDGMDISICYIDKKKMTMKWAGANNPLWIIRNDELIEIKGNKQPIGQFEPAEPFTTHEVPIEKDDRFYIFSDGYADQFGGEKGKKFKSSSLKKLLMDIHKLPIKIQHHKLEEQFDEWKGDYEQLDDVCIIGFQV